MSIALSSTLHDMADQARSAHVCSPKDRGVFMERRLGAGVNPCRGRSTLKCLDHFQLRWHVQRLRVNAVSANVPRSALHSSNPIDWNSSLYVNFVDYEKAFDSLDRDALWRLLRPGKLARMICTTYNGITCRVVHAGKLNSPFRLLTREKQGCLLSPFLFLLDIDWVMRKTTENRWHGIQWSLWTQLDDLNFAEDLALLSHSQQQMQYKTSDLDTTSSQPRLHIHRKQNQDNDQRRI